MRRAIALLLALVLLPLASAATTLVNEVSNQTANEQHWLQQFDAPAAAVADFDGDGRPEIVAHNDNQYVYVLSTTEPRILAEFRTEYPSGWGVRPINDPHVADVDNDGKLDIVVVNSAAVVCVYEHEGAFRFEKEWCRRMDAYDGGTAAADAGAAVGDVDGDGRKEIFSQTEKLGLYAFNWDGSVRWSKSTYGGNSGPLLSDLDGDGRKEVVFFGDGGEVKAFDASSGSQKWAFWASNYVKPASIPVAGNAADLDGDGRKEVVFSARDAPAGDTNYYDNHLMIFVLSSSGALKARWQPSWGNPMSYTHPVLIDVNGDGRRDILMQDWNTIGHKPGDWEKLGPANVFAYTGTGTLLWRTQLDNTWSNDDLAVADVDGDGAQEVLAIGWGPSGDGVWYLDLRTGAKEQHVGVGSWTALRGPIAGNLGGDGKTWWAISIHSSSKGGAYKVFRTDAACSVAFGGWANPNPCGGGTDGGGSTPPPPP
ncbi:MAG TPA: VCBS repeat-containing protein, partial [Candidatus Thermoplasmatota archaeon]|nr:VCBS repeat-containing protein [Candidatus Thermoplasmatota archaeon]